MKLKHILFCLFIVAANFIVAQEDQTGTIRGTIFSEAFGDKLQDVIILANDEEVGYSDLDGAFSIQLEPGDYKIEFNDFMFDSVTISNVTVVKGQVTVIGDILLPDSGEDATVELTTVVAVANRTTNSERALLSVKKNSAVILDGITAGALKLTGDGTAASAAKRVTGVSVEGGKYVYIRGLGDRYSKTMLNEVDIPGLDPDRNTLQMDIFPSNIIENLIVSKNFTADLPADFTGGVMNIETLAFPSKEFTNISLGIGYNPDMNLKGNFVTYNGGNTDWLGFDDGTRDLPDGARLPVNQFLAPATPGVTDQQVFDFVNSFDKTLAADKTNSFLNTDFSISTGNQYDLKNGNNIGLLFSMSYKNEAVFYENYQLGEYLKNPDVNQNELIYATTINSSLGEKNVLLGFLGGLSYKTKKSKYRLTAMRLQNGVKKAAQQRISNSQDAPGQSGYTGYGDVLEFNQRELTNILFHGLHKFKESNWELDWRLSPTFSKSDDPDIRKTAFTSQLTSTFNAGAAGNPVRIWRYLDEFNGVGKFDMTKKYKDNQAKFKFGARGVYKERDFEILQYNMQFFGLQPDWESVNNDFNQVLNEDFIYNNGSVYYTSGNAAPNPNAYEANSITYAAYVQNEINLFERLKTVIGLRVENFELRYTGSNQQGTINYNDKKVIESFDIFPSANLIFKTTDDMNIRAGYSKTTARPSFKEASYAQILDPITDRIFNGGLYSIGSWGGDLDVSMIQNFDLRWEFFPSPSELISVSGFYKSFDKPIEIVRLEVSQTGSEFQPRNVGKGKVLGVEFEIRKNLAFISESLSGLQISTNVTVVDSKIDMTKEEYESRANYARQGENIDETRDMAGQAPYVINAGLSYKNKDINMESGLFYNVKGETLSVVGIGQFPDVYTQPFHSLNFTFNKKFGKDQNTSLSFKIENILDDTTEDLYKSYKASKQVFESYQIGRTFSLGVSYEF